MSVLMDCVLFEGQQHLLTTYCVAVASLTELCASEQGGLWALLVQFETGAGFSAGEGNNSTAESAFVRHCLGGLTVMLSSLLLSCCGDAFKSASARSGRACSLDKQEVVAFRLTEDQQGTKGAKEFCSSTAHARPSPCLRKPLSECKGYKIWLPNDAAPGTLTLAPQDINGNFATFNAEISMGTGADVVPLVVEDDTCGGCIANGGLTETHG